MNASTCCRKWGVRLDGLTVGGTNIDMSETVGIVDSASSAIIVSKAESDAIHAVHREFCMKACAATRTKIDMLCII